MLYIQRHISVFSAVGSAQGKSTASRASPLPWKCSFISTASPMPSMSSSGMEKAVKISVTFSEFQNRLVCISSA